MLLAVMLVGLFMNAAIAHAFDSGGWAFVVPLLVIQGGRSILKIVTAPTRMLREHYARLLCWILATAPLWITGAILQVESRLLWWAGAAVIDLIGTWLAHPLPGRKLRAASPRRVPATTHKQRADPTSPTTTGLASSVANGMTGRHEPARHPRTRYRPHRPAGARWATRALST